MTKPTAKAPVRYEDAAQSVTITGWACKTCGRFYGDKPQSEHIARWCCATDLPCKECGGRNTCKSYTCCESCRLRHDEERWAKLERIDWDGVTPVCEWRNDRYYFSDGEVADEIAERLEDGGKIDDVRLVLCEPCDPPTFEMGDFLSDVLPEDFDPGKDFDEIDRIVNGWIKAKMPLSWFPTNKAISTESLRGLVE